MTEEKGGANEPLREYWESLPEDQKKLVSTQDVWELTETQLEERASILRRAREITKDFGGAPEPLRKALDLFKPSRCSIQGCKNESEKCIVTREHDAIDSEDCVVCYPVCKKCYEKVGWLWQK